MLASSGRRPVIGALGEGLLEVGVHPGLDQGTLARGFGGDAANVAVMAARLGADARLLSRVGDDAAGRLLLDFWRQAGVDVAGVRVDAGAPTGVYINERDERNIHAFSYHRVGSAATALDGSDVPDRAIAVLDVLHVTGITLSISPGARSAAEQAVDTARRCGVLVSFGVNHREALRPAAAALAAMARRADLVFLSVDDARHVLGVAAPDAVAAALPDAREVVLTDGPRPATVLADGEAVVLTPPSVRLVDAAGAGDALAGAYLATRLDGGTVADALAAGVAAGALSCRAGGCALSYPSAGEVAAALAGRADGGAAVAP
jgi:2-dehydro-3-deoxygluconokinase